jgi:hypothetical protein
MGYNFLFSYQCWQQVQAVAWNHHEPQVLSGYFDRSVVMVMKSLLCLLSIDLDCHYTSAQGFSFLDHYHVIVSFRCFGETVLMLLPLFFAEGWKGPFRSWFQVVGHS